MWAKDILSPEGFVRFLWAVMHILPNGLMAAGIKCSTWSIVNRALACKGGLAQLMRFFFGHSNYSPHRILD